MYLGLDIGTSSVKGVLMDTKQKIVASASAPLSVSRPHPGWSEQAPEDWWKACGKVVMALARQKPKAIAAVEGIGLSGQQHGATLLDVAAFGEGARIVPQYRRTQDLVVLVEQGCAMLLAGKADAFDLRDGFRPLAGERPHRLAAGLPPVFRRLLRPAGMRPGHA